MRKTAAHGICTSTTNTLRFAIKKLSLAEQQLPKGITEVTQNVMTMGFLP